MEKENVDENTVQGDDYSEQQMTKLERLIIDGGV